LVVDDEPESTQLLVEELQATGYEVQSTNRPTDALKMLAKEPVDLVITDVEMPELRGLDLMAAIQQSNPGQLVVLMTAFGSIELATQAVRHGAADFIAKPFMTDSLLLVIERVLRERSMRRELVRLRRRIEDSEGIEQAELVAKSPAMKKVLELGRKAADAGLPILLTGESGTGKSRIARFIHDASKRRQQPFVSINCAAVPSTLVEAELFGHKRGAFTDATEDRAGLFQQAEGGSLFLDEIGELPLDVQPKLLLALETGRVRPIGSSKEIASDVRLVAATNAAIEDRVKKGVFRADLYFRLNVVRIEIPPLRERREDLPELVDLVLTRAGKRLGRNIVGVASDAMRWIETQRWEGNVRELANVLERACVFAEHDTLVLDDVKPPTQAPVTGDRLLEAAERGSTLAHVERIYIREVLAKTGGNVSEAARILDIDRRTLQKKIEGEDGGG
jgi:DNA-binding NtrC family response regulator